MWIKRLSRGLQPLSKLGDGTGAFSDIVQLMETTYVQATCDEKLLWCCVDITQGVAFYEDDDCSPNLFYDSIAKTTSIAAAPILNPNQ